MNTNLPALANSPYALSITTTTGEQIQLAPGHSAAGIGQTSVADMLPGGGEKPLPRLIVAQPKDARGIEVSLQGQFIIQSSEQVVNDKGEDERIRSYTDPLGIRIHARVVGYTLNRSLMPKYDPRATGPDANKPLCHSENFLVPDARYADKYAHQCVAFDPQRGALVASCPMAAWGARDKQTGKSNPPPCNETYILALAIKLADQWVTCEAYFKSSSAKTGRTLIQQLRALELRNYRLYMYPVELWVTDAGVGYSMAGRLVLPPTSQPDLGCPDETDLEALEAGVTRWASALQYRTERANRTFSEDDTGGLGTEGGPDDPGSVADIAFPPAAPTIAPNIVATPQPAAPKPAATRKPSKAPMV